MRSFAFSSAVILDIQMPKLNGLEAATQIRSIAPQSKTPFVSQSTDPDIVHSAMRDGAARYLCKSKISRELVPAIEAAIAGKKTVYVEQGPTP